MKVKRKRAALWLGAMAVVATLLSVDTGVARADTPWHPILTWLGDSARCLDVRKQDDYYHANARVQLWNCSDALEQQWSFRFYGLEPPSGEIGIQKKLFQIINLRSGMCMEVRNGGVSPGEQVDQYPCAGAGGSIDVNANQLWETGTDGLIDGWTKWSLSPWSALRYVSMCLDVAGGDDHNGAKIQQYPCNRTDAQYFIGDAIPSS